MDKKFLKIRQRLLGLKRKASIKDWKDGIILTNLYLKKYKGSIPLLLDLAFFYYHYAGRLESIKTQEKYYQKAVRIYTDILKKDKNNINALHFFSRVLSMKKNKSSIGIAKMAYHKQPNFARALNLADIYANLSNFHLAEAWYKKTLKMVPNNLDKILIKGNLANFYHRFNKNKLAYKYAYEILAKIPKENMYQSLRQGMKQIILNCKKT